MTVLIAAIDESAASLPVLEVAQRLGELFRARVEAVHVREDGSGDNAGEIAHKVPLPLRVLNGDVVAELVAEVRRSDAIALVIGTRGSPGGASPAGHVAMDLVQLLDRPVVVVPPDATGRPLRRVLVAVEGDGVSHALRDLFKRLAGHRLPSVVALHVLEVDDLPMFADSPVLEAEAFGREFMIAAAGTILGDPSSVRLEMRVGDAPAALRDAVHELDIDLVVMSWHRDLSRGHGRLVREMLTEASVPIVLLPRERHHRRSPVSA